MDSLWDRQIWDDGWNLHELLPGRLTDDSPCRKKIILFSDIQMDRLHYTGPCFQESLPILSDPLCSWGGRKCSLLLLWGTCRASPTRRRGERDHMRSCHGLWKVLLLFPSAWSSFSRQNWAFREGTAHGNKTSSMIRCHFLNPARGSYLRIRPAGSKLKAIAGGTSSHGR